MFYEPTLSACDFSQSLVCPVILLALVNDISSGNKPSSGKHVAKNFIHHTEGSDDRIKDNVTDLVEIDRVNYELHM